jgi:hypothetical protein
MNKRSSELLAIIIRMKKIFHNKVVFEEYILSVLLIGLIHKKIKQIEQINLLLYELFNKYKIIYFSLLKK